MNITKTHAQTARIMQPETGPAVRDTAVLVTSVVDFDTSPAHPDSSHPLVGTVVHTHPVAGAGPDNEDPYSFEMDAEWPWVFYIRGGGQSPPSVAGVRVNGPVIEGDRVLVLTVNNEETNRHVGHVVPVNAVREDHLRSPYIEDGDITGWVKYVPTEAQAPNPIPHAAVKVFRVVGPHVYGRPDGKITPSGENFRLGEVVYTDRAEPDGDNDWVVTSVDRRMTMNDRYCAAESLLEIPREHWADAATWTPPTEPVPYPAGAKFRLAPGFTKFRFAGNDYQSLGQDTIVRYDESDNTYLVSSDKGADYQWTDAETIELAAPPATEPVPEPAPEPVSWQDKTLPGYLIDTGWGDDHSLSAEIDGHRWCVPFGDHWDTAAPAVEQWKPAKVLDASSTFTNVTGPSGEWLTVVAAPVNPPVQAGDWVLGYTEEGDRVYGKVRRVGDGVTVYYHYDESWEFLNKVVTLTVWVRAFPPSAFHPLPMPDKRTDTEPEIAGKVRAMWLRAKLLRTRAAVLAETYHRGWGDALMEGWNLLFDDGDRPHIELNQQFRLAAFKHTGNDDGNGRPVYVRYQGKTATRERHVWVGDKHPVLSQPPEYEIRRKVAEGNPSVGDWELVDPSASVTRTTTSHVFPHTGDLTPDVGVNVEELAGRWADALVRLEEGLHEMAGPRGDGERWCTEFESIIVPLGFQPRPDEEDEESDWDVNVRALVKYKADLRSSHSSLDTALKDILFEECGNPVLDSLEIEVQAWVTLEVTVQASSEEQAMDESCLTQEAVDEAAHQIDSAFEVVEYQAKSAYEV